MSELGWYSPEEDSTPQSAIPTTDAPAWSDYAKQFGVGASEFVSGARSGISYLDGKLGFTDAAQSAALGALDARETSKSLQESMTPAGQQAATGPLLSHPLRGLAMRGIAMSPALAAAALPGGLIADALGGTAGAIGAGAINAAISGGQFADQIAGRIDDTPDQELRKQSPTFDEMRKTMGEQDARANYRDYLADGQGRMALVLLGGALGGGFGVGGQIAKGATGKALGSAVEAGLAGGVQAGTSDAAYQSAMMQGGFQSHADVGEWAGQVFENMGIGALASGVHGLFGHKASDRTPTKVPVEQIDAAKPDVAQTAAIDASVNPPTPPAAAKSPEATEVAPKPTKPAQPPSPARPEPSVEAPTPPVTAEGNAVPSATPATEPTQPEAPTTLQAQYADLQKAQRPAMVFKQGEEVPKGFSGMGFKKLVIPTPEGPDIWIFNPNLVKQNDLRAAIRDNSAGEKYLGLGPVNKDEALSSAQQGATPLAITERTPEGVEVKAAAGTDQTAPTQVNALQENAAPGNSVQTENPAKVIAERQQAQVPPTTEPFVATATSKKVKPPKVQAALNTSLNTSLNVVTPEARAAAEATAAHLNARLPGARVFADVSDQGVAARQASDAGEAATAAKIDADTVKANAKITKAKLLLDPEDDDRKGRHWSPAERAKRQRDNTEAKKIVDAHLPTDAEDVGDSVRRPKPGAYNLIKERAKAMVVAARKNHISIPKSVRDAIDPNMESSPSLILLAKARELISPKTKEQLANENVPIGLKEADFAVFEKLERAKDRETMTMLRRTAVDKGGLGSPEGVSYAKGAHESNELSGHIPDAAPDETMSEYNRDDAAQENTPEEDNVADNRNQRNEPRTEEQIFSDVRDVVRPPGSKEIQGDVRVGEGGRPAPFVKVVDIAKRGIEDGTIAPNWVQVQRVLDVWPADAKNILTSALEQIKGEADSAPHWRKEYGLPETMSNRDVSEHHKMMRNAREDANFRKLYNIPDSVKDEELPNLMREKAGGLLNGFFGKGENAKTEGTTPESSVGYQSRAGKFEVAKSRKIKVGTKLAKMSVGEDWTVPVSDEEKSLPVSSTGKLSDIIGDLDTSEGQGHTRVIAKFLSDKLAAKIGDMDVHYVEQLHIDALFPEGDTIYGFFDPTYDHIVLSTSIPKGMETHVVLHEALHGALFHAIQNDGLARFDIRALMAEAKKDPYAKFSKYAFKNEHEFISEALSNPYFRNRALNTPISSGLAAQLGAYGQHARNLWGGLLHAFKRALGLPSGYTSVLDGVAAITQRLGLGEERGRPEVRERANEALAPITRQALGLSEDPQEEAHNPRGTLNTRERLLSSVSDHVASTKSWGNELWNNNALKFLSSDQLRQAKEHLFGVKTESNPVRRLVDSTLKANVHMQELLKHADPIVEGLWRASKDHQGPDWERFANLINESTRYNVHPDSALESDANAHLRVPDKADNDSEGAMSAWQSRAKHPELAREFNSLPKDLQQLYQKTRDYYAGERDARVKQHVKAVIEGHDAPEGVAKKRVLERILNGTMKDEDVEHYEKFGIGKALKTSRDMQRTTGPYFPLKRRGDYVVTGENEIKAPRNATAVEDKPNQFDFDTREEAHDWLTKQDLPAKVAKTYFDPETGEKTTKLGGLSTEGVATEKYRVTLQHKHVEFAETQADAERIQQRLKDAGLKNVSAPDKVEKNPGVDYGVRSSTLNHLIKAIERRDDLDSVQKATLTRSLEQTSVALQKGNRLESHYLERKNVAGASTDVIRNLTDYAHASAAFRARAEFKDGIDGALQDMRDLTNKDRSDPNTLDRRRVLQEYEQRIEGFGAPEYQGKMGPAWQRLMMLSFLKQMASPAHLALHLAHPVMTSIPVISGEHGLLRTQREFMRAYHDMGGGGALGEGVKGLMRVAKSNSGPTNFGDYFRKQLSKVQDNAALGNMMKELEATGHLHADSGFDVSRYDSSKTSLDRGLARVDRSFRELTSATESVNRYATAITAYRLAAKKGLSPEQAIRYAKDTVANTQGLYGASNSAPIFQGTGLKKAVMQFKQYPAMVINLMGKLVHDAFAGETPEIKRAALRSFATMMGTAAVLTGVNGLPTEGLKAVTLLGNALGVTPSWDEVTNNMRMGLAHNLGPTLGNLVMNGVSSMGPTAVDVHHRLGFSSLLTFGEPKQDPKTHEASPDAVGQWIMGIIGGAPLSLLTDTLAGAQALRHGDLETAFEKLTPIKALDDLAKAGRLAVQGKPTPSGKPGMRPLTGPETLMQGIGFTPRSVADYGEAKYNAQRDIKALPTKPQHGPKGQQILGIANSKRDAPIVKDYSKSYGVE